MPCFGRAKNADDDDDESSESSVDQNAIDLAKFERMHRDDTSNFLSLVPLCKAHPDWISKLSPPSLQTYMAAEVGDPEFWAAAKIDAWNINEELGPPYEQGTLLLHVLARAGHLHLLQKALELGADHTARNAYGEAPLFLAASYGHPAVVAFLRESGADVNQTNSLGEAPIYAAAYRGHLHVIKELLKDPHINYLAKTDEGATALFASTARGHMEVSEYLREWVNQRRAAREAASA